MILEDLKYQHFAGRLFVWGVADCLALVQDFYRENFGIPIRDYARPTHWSSDKIDLMRMIYPREGFDIITDWKPAQLRPGDVLAIMLNESNPNHLAVYVGDDTIVHHLYGRMSNVEPLRGFWRNQASFILRHPDVPDLTPVYPDVDIRSILSARNSTTG